MKTRVLLVSILLQVFVGGVHAAEKENLALLDTTSKGPRFDTISTSTEAGSSDRSVVAKLRKRRSQAQFEQTMLRYYPEGYRVMMEMSPEDRLAIYRKYRSGARMASVRVAVFELAAKGSENP